MKFEAIAWLRIARTARTFPFHEACVFGGTGYRQRWIRPDATVRNRVVLDDQAPVLSVPCVPRHADPRGIAAADTAPEFGRRETLHVTSANSGIESIGPVHIRATQHLQPSAKKGFLRLNTCLPSFDSVVHKRRDS